MTGRGFSTRPTRLGRWRYPAFALVLSFALVITVLPTILLVTGTFMKLFGFFNIAEPWTLENWRATAMIRCYFARCGTPWPSVLGRDSSAYCSIR